MLIDTHCHLDAAVFQADRAAVLDRARRVGVRAIVVPAVAVSNFEAVRRLAHATPGVGYALGIHPLYVAQAQDSDLDHLQHCLQVHQADPKLLAIGEIGLDFFVPEHAEGPRRARQEHFFERQLQLAAAHGLPVLLHGRKAQDRLLKYMRRQPGVRGIAHAFNGSFQQAGQFIELGFVLGMGGALTYPRALQIRRLASGLPEGALVLETDAPDMPPAWLGAGRGAGAARPRNEPAELARIAQALARLRAQATAHVVHQCALNAGRVLPRLQALLASESL
ncbi:TatD family hydrolase [Castellaniella sp.]|uniref:TatD family hydrolase n=1 Tax=Castellaniella sp. TaxID=1955812 RepID=UPI003567C208